MTTPLYPGGYPIPANRDDEALSLVADVAAIPYLTALVRPLGQIDDRVAALFSGLADLGDATGWVLDLAGDRVGEPRGGLSDNEYRRIIAGRRVAAVTGCTAPTVYAGWVALTESGEARLEQPGANTVLLTARVPYAPTTTWLQRAGLVVRDLVMAGVDVEATVYSAGTAVYDAIPGYDVGTYAWSLYT